MYYHVIENCQRAGVQGYRLVKTYRSAKRLYTWLEKTGAPVWVLESNRDFLPYRGELGGFPAAYWNTGGWGLTTMPKLPLHEGR